MFSTSRAALLASASALGLVSAFAMPAAAQTAENDYIQVSQAQPGPEAQTPAETEATQETSTVSGTGEEEVVVVGSRLRRSTYNSASPLQVITREDSVMAGYNSATDVIQSTAVTGGAAQINDYYGGYVTDGGPGANTIGLRGLGAGRTLVLLNGRRVAPAGTRGAVGTADLNVLPSAMIERVEILRDGASSTYGSDAIAGVVNVITRDKIEGLTIESQYNRPKDPGGEEVRVSIVGGAVGDNWSIAGSAEYYEQTEIEYGDRSWSQCERPLVTDPDTGLSEDYIDPFTGKPKCWGINEGGVTINTIGTVAMPGIPGPGTGGTRFNRWRPNSAITVGLPGFEGVSADSRDSFSPAILDQSLVSPLKIWTAYVKGDYEISSSAELYAEGLFTTRKSEQTGNRQYIIDYVEGSPLLPENLRDLPAIGAAASGPLENQDIGVRAFIDAGKYESRQDVDYYKFTGGVRGDLGLGDWRYDVNIQYSDSDARYSFENSLKDKLYNASLAVEAPEGFTGPTQNGLTCAINLTSPGENCILAPFLTSKVIGGDLPENFKDYINKEVGGRTQYQETAFTAQVDGTVAEIWDGNSITGAFGLEYRTAEIDDTPDIDAINQNVQNFTSALPTRGDDSVWEAYAEVEIPLLKDRPWADDLTINLQGRYTDYESYGGDWTYKVAGMYSPFEWVGFRATYGTSYRAPALFEQFQGSTTGFQPATFDPCYYEGVEAGTTLEANCVSEVGPLYDPETGEGFQPLTGVEIVQQGGSAFGLEAETSDNFTAGVVFNTEIDEDYGNLSVAVDYYNIEISNGVGQLGESAIVDLCYNDADFRNGSPYCALVVRDPTNNSLTVYDSFRNIATQSVEGIDYNLRYDVEIEGGELVINAQVQQMLEQPLQLFPEDETIDYNGTLGSPEYTGTFDISYEYSGIMVRYGMEWVAAMESYELYDEDPYNSFYDLGVDNYFLHNFSVRYRDEDNGWEGIIGVRNAFDEEPPVISSLNFLYNGVSNRLLYSGYDYNGRTFFVNVSASFN